MRGEQAAGQERAARCCACAGSRADRPRPRSGWLRYHDAGEYPSAAAAPGTARHSGPARCGSGGWQVTGARHEYEWVTELPLNGSPDSPRINFVQLRIVSGPEVAYHNAWVTDLVPTAANIAQLVRAGRARWKIEHEGFNTLKNHGYHLEHNFGHGQQHLSAAFFVLNLLAFFLHQIFELADGLYQRVRAGFGSRREFWGAVRAAFRLFLFQSWDQVLARMNSPPQPLPA